MENWHSTVVVQDKKLTKDLKKRSSALIEKFKKMSLDERWLHCDELWSLLSEIIENKNQNFKNFVQKNIKQFFSSPIEIASVHDEETEEIIGKIFSIFKEEAE